MPNSARSSALSRMRTHDDRVSIASRTASNKYLPSRLRSTPRLLPPDYADIYRTDCNTCSIETGEPCDIATKASCAEVGCDEAEGVMRRLPANEIFIGRIGSGNAVMKSGTDRDRIAAEHDIIALEMEGAGTWDETPCIVVKGISDYADSRKNKQWQDFSAATAASVAKAMIDRYVVDDEVATPVHSNVSVPTSTGRTTGQNRSLSNNSFGNGAWINQGDVRGSG